LNWSPLGSPKPPKKKYILKRTKFKKRIYKLKRIYIRPISKKQSKRLKEYSKLKAELNIKICSHCGKEFEDYHNIDLDHVQQKGQGGKDVKENLRGLCRNCHRERHGKLGLKHDI
jgi:5-methylcytosine-specific restriction endonuclease McrA